MSKTIVYEPHPISAERKAELIARGFRIIDARFAPDDAPKPEELVVEVIADPAAEVIAEPIAEPAKKRGRPTKVATDA